MTPDRPALLGGTSLSAEPLGMARPCLPRLEAVRQPMADVLRSGMVTNQSRHVGALERQLAELLDLPSVACTCNGQSAVILALRAAGIDGGEVIVPSYTFSATPHAVRWCGATPVFADIRRDTLCLDPIDAAGRVTERTVAVMPVDVYGTASDYDAFEEMSEEHGLRLVIDSAPAFGTRVDGCLVGGRGDAQAFSFHATKAFTTMEGGCVAAQDPALVARVASLRNFGQSDGPDCAASGLNAKMMEVCAIIGLELLDGLDETVRRRGAIAARYRRGLSEIPGLSFTEPPADQAPTWLYFPLLVDAARFGLDRDSLAKVLTAENLLVRPYFGLPCHHMACYPEQHRLRLPVTEAVAATVLTLPIYNDMTDSESDLFVEAIRRAHRCAGEIRARVAPEARGTA